MAGKGKRVVIVGGGVGGYVAGIRAAQLGAQVTLIEKDVLGGTCVNRGCIPTKVLLQSAEVMSCAKSAAEFGVKLGDLSLDFSVVAGRRDAVVGQLRNGVVALMRKNSIKVVAGTAEIHNPQLVKIAETGESIQGDAVIIATGSTPSTVSVPGIDQSGVVNSDEFLAMKSVPGSALVIGGGVIGLEYAQILHGMGAKVVVVEMLSQLLPREDQEIAEAMKEIFRNRGVEIYNDAVVSRISEAEQGKKNVAIGTQDGEITRTVDSVVVAAGRAPKIDGLSLREIGVAIDRGAIEVNEKMETNVPGVFAVGDVTGGYMLAHVAMHEGVCAAENAVGLDTNIDYKTVPRCIYTSPEMAAVGLIESEAREKHDNVKVGRFPFAANGRAVTLGETTGMVKVITDAKYGEILGVHILGPQATDLIMEAVLAIRLDATVEDLATAIHPHPTLSEALMEASLRTQNLSIHI